MRDPTFVSVLPVPLGFALPILARRSLEPRICGARAGLACPPRSTRSADARNLLAAGHLGLR